MDLIDAKQRIYAEIDKERQAVREKERVLDELQQGSSLKEVFLAYKTLYSTFEYRSLDDLLLEKLIVQFPQLAGCIRLESNGIVIEKGEFALKIPVYDCRTMSITGTRQLVFVAAKLSQHSILLWHKYQRYKEQKNFKNLKTLLQEYYGRQFGLNSYIRFFTEKPDIEAYYRTQESHVKEENQKRWEPVKAQQVAKQQFMDEIQSVLDYFYNHVGYGYCIEKTGKVD